MLSRLMFRPDLDECALEDRTLMAYSPSIPGTILTTGGYIIITTPPGLSTVLGTFSTGAGGGSGGNSGGNMPTSFNISGFGPSSFTIGNNLGYPALNARGGVSGSGGSNFGAAIGSGANTGGSSGSGGLSNFSGYGGSFSSGYGTSLNSMNNFGMAATGSGSSNSSSASSSSGSGAPADTSATQAGVDTASDTNNLLYKPGLPTQGLETRPGNSLLGKTPGGVSMPRLPGLGQDNP